MAKLLSRAVLALGLVIPGIAALLTVAAHRFDRNVAADRRRLLSTPRSG